MLAQLIASRQQPSKWYENTSFRHGDACLFIGHGSPMTVITDNPECRYLEYLGTQLPQPRAILCVTAHWETHGATHVTDGEYPSTIHDFRGFPQELYEVEYPAPAPTPSTLHARVEELTGGIVRDATWGFDHGVWGVLRPLFPNADVPVLAMSLDRNLNAQEHLQLGRKLAPLRREGVMIIGSGNVIHNLARWRESAGTVPDWADAFRDRINAAVMADNVDALTGFSVDDHIATTAINSEEHYLPLLYVVGARLPPDMVSVFNDTIDGALSMTSYLLDESILAPGAEAQFR